jgi:hypothetical protein
MHVRSSSKPAAVFSVMVALASLVSILYAADLVQALGWLLLGLALLLTARWHWQH